MSSVTLAAANFCGNVCAMPRAGRALWRKKLDWNWAAAETEQLNYCQEVQVVQYLNFSFLKQEQ